MIISHKNILVIWDIAVVDIHENVNASTSIYWLGLKSKQIQRIKVNSPQFNDLHKPVMLDNPYATFLDDIKKTRILRSTNISKNQIESDAGQKLPSKEETSKIVQ